MHCFTMKIGSLQKILNIAPEPTLNHYVVRPSGFAIHALTDSILTKEILVLTARKLTPPDRN